MSRRIAIPNSSDYLEVKRDADGPYLDLSGQRVAVGNDNVLLEDFVTRLTNVELVNKLAAAGGGTGQSWSEDIDGQARGGWGVLNANMGTGAGSRLDIVPQGVIGNNVAIGQGIAYEMTVRFQLATLSTPAQRYITFDGAFDHLTVDPDYAIGCLFRYSDNLNGGKFEAVCRSNNSPVTETVVDTGVLVAVDTWYKLRLVINAAATSVKFYIKVGNGPEVLVATISTNIVKGTADNQRYVFESDTDRLTSSGASFISRRFDYYMLRAIGMPSRF